MQGINDAVERHSRDWGRRRLDLRVEFGLALQFLELSEPQFI